MWLPWVCGCVLPWLREPRQLVFTWAQIGQEIACRGMRQGWVFQFFHSACCENTITSAEKFVLQTFMGVWDYGITSCKKVLWDYEEDCKCLLADKCKCNASNCTICVISYAILLLLLLLLLIVCVCVCFIYLLLLFFLINFKSKKKKKLPFKSLSKRFKK